MSTSLQLFTADEAAHLLGCDRKTFNRYRIKPVVAGRRGRGHKALFSLASLSAFKPPTRGRPLKPHTDQMPTDDEIVTALRSRAGSPSKLLEDLGQRWLENAAKTNPSALDGIKRESSFGLAYWGEREDPDDDDDQEHD